MIQESSQPPAALVRKASSSLHFLLSAPLDTPPPPTHTNMGGGNGAKAATARARKMEANAKAAKGEREYAAGMQREHTLGMRCCAWC